MEFRFNINKIFKNNISRIGNSLLPTGFVAPDRRTALDTTAYVAEIINTIGQASAAAQGLNQAVTTSDRLRNCDEQAVYLMTEDNGKNGLVVGLLKVGRKSLYVFDKYGDTKHVNAPCVLDFYIHESRQRAGLGKILFEYMLEYENLLPEQLAIDRPSEKLLSFLRKHYALTQKIPQMNNFVIYDGFFASQESERSGLNVNSNMHITASPNSNLFGPQFISDDNPKRRSNSRVRDEAVQNQVFGRYAAPRPICSLNQIIHNKPVTSVTEPNSDINLSKKSHDDSVINHADENTAVIDEQLAHDIESLDVVGKVDEGELPITPSPSVSPAIEPDEDQVDGSLSNGTGYYQRQHEFFDDPESQNQQQYFRNNQSFQQQQQQQRISPIPYHFNKRQTGKKNISNIVVGTDNKIEFDQVDDKGFGVVKINRPIGVSSRSSTHEHLNDNESINSHDSERTHTAEGYFDLKFFSHRLW